jgi:hypothetical protein
LGERQHLGRVVDVATHQDHVAKVSVLDERGLVLAEDHALDPGHHDLADLLLGRHPLDDGTRFFGDLDRSLRRQVDRTAGSDRGGLRRDRLAAGPG